MMIIIIITTTTTAIIILLLFLLLLLLLKRLFGTHYLTLKSFKFIQKCLTSVEVVMNSFGSIVMEIKDGS